MDLVVNGKRSSLSCDPQRPLLWVLRNELNLTGAKYGCGEGECAACTVLIDGVPTHSCITPVGTATGKEITTIEGIADGDRLHPVQTAFIESDAMQCGYCTPGMILASVALLRKKPAPAEPEIRTALEGHICRCGTYNRIVEAVQKASRSMTSEVKEPHRA
jgi:aerobic-type carbon monoxide dehydrogenase small subunit (CoxS/CutS family)